MTKRKILFLLFVQIFANHVFSQIGIGVSSGYGRTDYKNVNYLKQSSYIPINFKLQYGKTLQVGLEYETNLYSPRFELRSINEELVYTEKVKNGYTGFYSRVLIGDEFGLLFGGGIGINFGTIETQYSDKYIDLKPINDYENSKYGPNLSYNASIGFKLSIFTIEGCYLFKKIKPNNQDNIILKSNSWSIQMGIRYIFD